MRRAPFAHDFDTKLAGEKSKAEPLDQSANQRLKAVKSGKAITSVF
jgi:hypothetical protein